jgi:hypothetical protein
MPSRLPGAGYRLTVLELAVAMPATAATQVAAGHAREAAAHVDDDLSTVVRAMRSDSHR